MTAILTCSEIEFLTFSSETKSEVMRKCEEGRQIEKLNKENYQINELASNKLHICFS